MNLLTMFWIPQPTDPQSAPYRNIWQRWHIDTVLLTFLLLLSGMGLLILYSASNGDTNLVIRQIIRLLIAFGAMLLMAQIPAEKLKSWALWLYLLGLLLLLAVLIMGEIGKGAQRWLDIGPITFQPSELMKLAMPMTIAWYLAGSALPPSFSKLVVTGGMILIPALFIAKQPDLGTALMIVIAGATALFLAGIGFRYLLTITTITGAALPLLWHFMHDYQRQRVLTFLDPENDPLGKGYHIIQSKIAIGSGGLFGKGWLHGTQSHLDFLPEHATDFIFGVCGEEFGWIGCVILIGIYLSIVMRGIYIALRAQETFTRLLAGSITLMFFFSFFINMGMVIGILPVVGIPLPLVSYGGTSMVTIMASLGILMSIQTRRKLLGS